MKDPGELESEAQRGDLSSPEVAGFQSPPREEERDLVAERYQVTRLLGEGKMGRVYLADDRDGRKQVALKFPKSESSDLYHRLIKEVGIAQTVSHPNVCRIHDLGVHKQQTFVSMQFVDGPTLREALDQPLGQLTVEERLRIAYGLCDGLEAIHQSHIYHRDLKPSNVMLDALGQPVITDFGLAVFAGGLADQSGTPEYMAPELSSGGSPSIQSDIFALGLILYELMTGRHAFENRPISEISEQELEKPRAFPPGCKVGEDIIQACLLPDPLARPKTAAEVAAGLPDPVFPSSEWVVPPSMLLSVPRFVPEPRNLRVLFGVFVLVLALVAWLGPKTEMVAAIEHPPVVFEKQARDILFELGLDDPDGFQLFGFSYDSRDLAFTTGDDLSSAKWPSWAGPAASPISFWYRQSPAPIKARRPGAILHRQDDPTLTLPGSTSLSMNPQGHLLSLEVVLEEQSIPGHTSIPEPDWQPLLKAAGWEPGDLRRVETSWSPPRFANQQAAWQEKDLDTLGIGLRIEAAALNGRFVAFQVLKPWQAAPEKHPVSERNTERKASPFPTERWSVCLFLVAVLIGTVLLARRNIRLGAADLSAAGRLAIFVLVTRFLVGLLGAHHVASPYELRVLQAHMAQALFAAAALWLIYVALEPLARRHQRDLTASWVRLLYGRRRDPLVGRDLLVGSLCGTAVVLWARLYALGCPWVGLTPPRPDRLSPLAWQIGHPGLALQLEALRGVRQTLAIGAYVFVHAVLVAFFVVVAVLLLRHVLARPLFSRPAAFLLFLYLTYPAAGQPIFDLLAAAVASSLWLFVLVRFGFLSAVTATVCSWFLSSHPLTLDPSSWYVGGSFLALLGVLSIAAYGFFVGMGDEPILPNKLLPDV